MNPSASASSHVVGSNFETDGLPRSHYQDVDTSPIPFELAIASGDRSKAIALQEHIEFTCAAILMNYEKKTLLLHGRLTP